MQVERNIIIPPTTTHDLRSINHVCKLKGTLSFHPPTTQKWRSIDHKYMYCIINIYHLYLSRVSNMNHKCIKYMLHKHVSKDDSNTSCIDVSNTNTYMQHIHVSFKNIYIYNHKHIKYNLHDWHLPFRILPEASHEKTGTKHTTHCTVSKTWFDWYPQVLQSMKNRGPLLRTHVARNTTHAITIILTKGQSLFDLFKRSGGLGVNGFAHCSQIHKINQKRNS